MKYGASTKADMQTNGTKLNIQACLHVTSAIEYLTKRPKSCTEGKAASLTNCAGGKLDAHMLKNIFKPVSITLHKKLTPNGSKTYT